MPLALLLVLSGCRAAEVLTGVTIRSASHVAMGVADKVEHKAMLLEERRLDEAAVQQAKLEDLEEERRMLQLTREALVARRKVERQSLQDQQEMKRESLQAETEFELEATKPRYREGLQSQLGFNLNQSFQMGQLQVDMKQLQRLMDDRKILFDQQKADYDRKVKDRRTEQLRAALGDNTDLANCALPARQKLQNAEALKEPVMPPILPTEVPLMIPVSLNIEMQNPTIGQPRVRRIPLQDQVCVHPSKENLEDCTNAVQHRCTCEPGCAPCDSCVRLKSQRDAGGIRGILNRIPPLPGVSERN